MIISIYQELKRLKTPTEIRNRLMDIGYWEMFEPLCPEYPRWENVVQWIIQCFSIDSDQISINEDYEKTRRKIAAKLGINDDDIILLKHPTQPEPETKRKKKKTNKDEDQDEELDEDIPEEITEKINVCGRVVLAYLEQQAAREFKHLIILRLTYERFLNSVLEVDYDQQKKNLQNAKDIYADVLDYEQRVAQKLGDQHYRMFQDLDKHSGTKRIDLRVESSPLIK